jgi:hypothetical protein
MPTNTISCAVVCPIELPYEVSADCSTTKAGIEPNMWIIGYCQLASVLTSTGDANITDIIASVGEAVVAVQFKESETSAVITGTLNDNDNAVEMDEIEGKGTAVGVDAFKFARQFQNKEIVVIVERADGVPMCFGWNGGLKLREWKYETGKKPNDDFHGFSFKFDNKTKKTGLIISGLDPDDYPNGFEDLIAALS